MNRKWIKIPASIGPGRPLGIFLTVLVWSGFFSLSAATPDSTVVDSLQNAYSIPQVGKLYDEPIFPPALIDSTLIIIYVDSFSNESFIGQIRFQSEPVGELRDSLLGFWHIKPTPSRMDTISGKESAIEGFIEQILERKISNERAIPEEYEDFLLLRLSGEELDHFISTQLEQPLRSVQQGEGEPDIQLLPLESGKAILIIRNTGAGRR